MEIYLNSEKNTENAMTPYQTRIITKIIEFVCQVLINCEQQIQRYDDDNGCSTLLGIKLESLNQLVKRDVCFSIGSRLIIFLSKQ